MVHSVKVLAMEAWPPECAPRAHVKVEEKNKPLRIVLWLQLYIVVQA